MDPLCVTKVDIWQHKFFGKEWKSYLAAVFAESEFGRARVELFSSPKKMKALTPNKTILLDQCVALKSLRNGEEHPNIRLQMKDDSEIRVRCEQHSQLMNCLSTAAFPKKYVTIAPSTSMESSSSENDDTQFYDEYPVLLVPSTLTAKRNLAEGNYSLRFSKEDLSLIHGNAQIQHFPYNDISWVAAGENSLGLAIENCGVYEFICDQPLLIIDHMRNYIRFKNSFPAVRLSTKRKYNRFYHQAREFATSGSDLSHASTIESHGSSKASVMHSEHHLPPVIEELEKTHVKEENVAQKPPRGKSKEGVLSGLFRINSKKKPVKGARTDFEENADSEWLRLPVPPKALNGVEQNGQRIDDLSEDDHRIFGAKAHFGSAEAVQKQQEFSSRHRRISSAGVGR
ncbi:unnamed protein product [Cylicocyclus nassatus]|uniref:Uncharacterized protein n=1 Tax=Cylicocyclus nassatus TaxID=53992 RepID=A0AA36HF31_CYLNA|nr:unnamed protein product [Cylicocyclus nassatus]